MDTYQKALESLRESEARLKDSQRVARIGHYTFFITQDVWTCSEMLDHIFGIDGTFAKTASSWVALIHPDDQASMVDYLQNHVLRDRNMFDREYRIVRQGDGESRWVYGRGSLELGPDGNLTQMFGTIQDITERKQIELEKDRLFQELDIRQKEQESLIFVLSHDLRSPMVNIMGFASELKEDLAAFLSTTSEDKRRELLPSINDSLHYLMSSTERMDRMQNGMLRFARLGRMELQSQPVSPTLAIRNALVGMEHQARRLKLQVEDQSTHPCSGDPRALENVFANLIDNSIKYARPGVPCLIRVSSRKERDKVVYSRWSTLTATTALAYPPRPTTRYSPSSIA